MKPAKGIALIILFVFLTAWSVKAHEPHIGNGIFAAKQLNMLIEQHFEELGNQIKLRNRDLTIHSWIRVNCYDA